MSFFTGAADSVKVLALDALIVKAYLGLALAGIAGKVRAAPPG
ncbi:hypothetical protein CFter6_4403 [Collimonas fungivorans]|uniref:Uncharacterized protein n=1 Tax=Collimonas fungivorans TaxID=158899 RepID=A0A127PGR0_9BURK|nr:hypothetical protein CFter6_4403 [Collimonas fungivorans]